MSDIGFIKYLFNSYIGRDPTTDELGTWIQEYNKLEPTNRKELITDKFKQSDLYLNSFVDQLYTKYYHRSPTSDELKQSVDQLKTKTIDQPTLISQFEMSIEYFIVEAYNKYLLRDPETATRSARKPRLTEQKNECLKTNSVDTCKFNLRNILKPQMMNSSEYKGNVVKKLYNTYLNRVPSEEELKAWNDAYTNNRINEQHIILYLKTSDEYKSTHNVDNLFSYEGQTPNTNYTGLLDISNKKLNSYASELERQSTRMFEFTEHQKSALDNRTNTPTTTRIHNSSRVRYHGIGYLDRSLHSCPDGYAMHGITWHNLSNYGLEAKALCKKIQPDMNVPNYASIYNSAVERFGVGGWDSLPDWSKQGLSYDEWIPSKPVEEAKDNLIKTYDVIKPLLPNSSTLIEPFDQTTHQHTTNQNHANQTQSLVKSILDRLSQFGQQIKHKIKMYETFDLAYSTNTNKNGTTDITQMIDNLYTKFSMNGICEFRNIVDQLKSYNDLNEMYTDRFLYLVNLSHFNIDTRNTLRNIAQSVKQLYNNTHNFVIANPDDLLLSRVKGLKSNKHGFVIDDNGLPHVMNNQLREFNTKCMYVWIVANENGLKNVPAVIKFDISANNIYHITKKMYDNIKNGIHTNNNLVESLNSLKSKLGDRIVVETDEHFSVKYENLQNQLSVLFKYIDQLIIENDKLISDISIDEIDLYTQPDLSDCITRYSGRGGTTFSDPEKRMIYFDRFNAECPDGYGMKSYQFVREGGGKYIVKYKCCRI